MKKILQRTGEILSVGFIIVVMMLGKFPMENTACDDDDDDRVDSSDMLKIHKGGKNTYLGFAWQYIQTFIK